MNGWSLHPKLKKPLGLRLFEELILRSWWVYGFILLCFIAFKPILRHLEKEKERLLNSLTELETSKNELVQLQQNLKLELESQKDPYWVEMILKKELGLVSEGQTKIRFVNPG